MKSIESTLKSYLRKCESVFEAHRSKIAHVVGLPGISDPTKHSRSYINKAIDDAERTEEFEAFVRILNSETLSAELTKLCEQAKASWIKLKEERENSGMSYVTRNFDQWEYKTARLAAQRFFRNTGTYLFLWDNIEFDESKLVHILESYRTDNQSECVRLFIFDGFVLFDDNRQIQKINLPVGELKLYEEKELERLLLFPQSTWHDHVDPDLANRAATWHILTTREKEEYRGRVGLWLGDALLTPIGFDDIGERTVREQDIEIIGPVFLCIGENANLAVEIQIRTNVFDGYPVSTRLRNDFLPWDLTDEHGDPQPRTIIKRIGEDGIVLKNVFNIWREVNSLDKKGLLRFPTEAYVRSVMNLHTSTRSLMEIYVNLVTVIESLMTPGSRTELAYKMALRGAALLTNDPAKRLDLLKQLHGFYKTRSDIVHGGDTGIEGAFELRNTISGKLLTITRQVFLRYITIIYLGILGDLPGWVLDDCEKLQSNTARARTISEVLDAIIMDTSLTVLVEEKMAEWGIDMHL